MNRVEGNSASHLGLELGLGATAALLIVLLSDTLGVGVWALPFLAGGGTFLLLQESRPSVMTALFSALLVIPMIAVVVVGAYIIDSLFS